MRKMPPPRWPEASQSGGPGRVLSNADCMDEGLRLGEMGRAVGGWAVNYICAARMQVLEKQGLVLIIPRT